MNARQMMVVVGMLVAGLLMAMPAHAALFEETFDSYTVKENYWPTASDSWISETDGAVFSIVNNVAVEGNSVKLESMEQRLYHEFERQTSGVFSASWYMRNNSSGYRGVTVCLADDWTNRGTYVTMHEDGNLQYNDGAWKTLTTYASKEWVKVQVVVDMDAKNYDILVNDVVLATDVGFNKSGVTGISRIYLDNSGPATNWVDQISIVPEPTILSMLAIGGLGVLIRRRK